MNIGDVMDEIGTRLDAIPGLNTFAYSVKKVTPPAASVSLPERVTYDQTYGRGSDSMTLEILVAVGSFSARSSRDAVSKYAAGSGTHSVKAHVDSTEDNEYTSCDTVTVTEAEFLVSTTAGADLLSVAFTVNVFGEGAQ